MSKAIFAGVLYFAIAFAAGFALGAVRVTFVAPAVGDLRATLIELPVILAASWAACAFVISRLKVAPRVPARIVMGAVAFVFLMTAEIALGLGLMNRTLAAQLEAMTGPPALLGVAAQIVFAFFPLIALSQRR